MKTTAFRAKALACALLGGTALCGLSAPASAQSSPTFRNLDSNGVDLVRGDFLTSFVEGSIGSGEAELALLRMVGATGSNGTTGSSQWDHIFFNIVPSGTYVDFGSRNDRFPGAESRGASLTGSGNSYRYFAPDGTVIAFADPSGGTDSNFCNGTVTPSCILFPVSITSPDNKVVDINYEFWTRCTTPSGGGGGGGPPEEPRDDDPDPINVCAYETRIGSVSNSYGYEIRFAYAAPAGNGPSAAPPGFYQRTGATFHNNVAGSSPLASVSYDYLSGGVTKVTDTGGRQWFVTSDQARYAIRRPGAPSDTHVATLVGGVVTHAVKEGATTTYARSVAGNVVTMLVTNALNQTSQVISDLATGRPSSVKDPLNNITTFEYDPSNRLKKLVAPEGNYVEHTYDARGNVIATAAVPKNGVGPRIVTSASFDQTCANPVTCNRPNSTTDARGNVTNYEYDPSHGGVTKVTYPAPTPNAVRPETRYSYTLVNEEWQLTGVSQCRTTSACAGTADEVKTALAYDSNGNLYWTATGNGSGSLVASATMSFDPVGNMVSVDGPLAGADDTSHARYNAARQVTGTISPDPDGAGPLRRRAVRNSYGGSTGLLDRVEQGNVDGVTDAHWNLFSPAQAVETIYDDKARPKVTRLVSGSTVHSLTQMEYDALGRPLCSAQRMNPAAFGSLPGDACALGTQGTAGPDRISKTIYDPAGRVSETIVALGTGDQATEATTTYTANGKVQTVTDGENNRTTYEYDGHDRLARTYYPMPGTKNASNGADFEQLTYESLAGGTRTSPLVAAFLNRGGQSIGFGYDGLGRLVSKDRPGSEPDVAYGYDLLGRLTSAGQPGHALGFTYDALGRVLDQSGPMGIVASEWDLAGRRTKLSWPDGFFVTYDHLLTGEVTAIRENGAASGIGLLAAFAYDDLGRRKSLTLGNGAATHYRYDAASRLDQLKLDFAGTSADLTSEFAYNPAGQIAGNARSNDAYAWTGHGSGTISTTANGLNQISSWVGTLGYDAKGNIVSDGTYAYGYSSENLLTSLTNATPGAIQAWSTYSYDPLMRLAVIDSSNNSFDASLAYDGQDFILEGLSGGRARRYVRGPGVDEPLVAYLVTPAGTSRLWYQADERGSIVRHSNDAGTPGQIGKYDEYGVGGTGRIRYAGQYWLGDGNLIYSRARIYDARLGRFLQPDPIGYGSGMNIYAYVLGDPINLIDPSGLGCISYKVGGGVTEEGGDVVIQRGRYEQACWDAGGGSGSTRYFDGVEGGGGSTPAEVQCKLGKGAIDVRFDGTTVNITANINLVGPGAETSGAYIAGIGKAWTRSFGHINSIANISAGPGGVTAHISSERYPPPNEHGHHGPRADLGGNKIWLGNLGAMPDWQRSFAVEHVGPHEFGHPLGIRNMPNEGKWRGSIMANSANNVSATDLEAVVELCRTAE
jgi:RHS repeat-associated protein